MTIITKLTGAKLLNVEIDDIKFLELLKQ